MNKLLKNPWLRLMLAGDKKVLEDTFSSGLDGWNVIQGDWHKVTVDTNEDESSGLAGGIALDCAGSYNGGIMEKTVDLKNYSEIYFEHYVQNPKEDTEPNVLKFYIDGVLKLKVNGASPWITSDAFGVAPGKHTFRFEYQVSNPMGKKGVVDTFRIYEGRDINALITEYKPPTPSKKLASQDILRGFTRYQQMVEDDTQINFTACFNGLDYQDFISHYDDIFYFLDEFGVLYRGTFPGDPECKSVALRSIYYVDLKMACPQKAGKGFL